ncbi:MAG: hypothetical protein ACOYOV_13955 [Bacteroidales bacterium]
MTRSQLIAELKKHFDIRELVCQHTFTAFGEKSWQFIDFQQLQALYILRFEIFPEGMIVNNYSYPHSGKTYTQRGVRCNICQICKDKTLAGSIYMSAHANGAGDDFDVPGLTAEESRQIIIMNADKFPFKIRLESKVNWVHVDVYDDPLSTRKVTLF